jgi:tRNA (adenine37-N6)-methyltransferase
MQALACASERRRTCWTRVAIGCHSPGMPGQPPAPTVPDRFGLREGERSVTLPASTDAGVYFIGRIRTPWPTRSECPKRGSLDGPVCTIELDARWAEALSGIDVQTRLQVLYWMDQARRDLVVQNPGRAGTLLGSFALRSPVRPNPIASSIVALDGRDGTRLLVRGLDCVDGTPLLDLKPAPAP